MKKLKNKFIGMSKRTAVFLLITGLILGTVFTFGMLPLHARMLNM